ncbi:hypothetical protein NKJ51_15540 [Mesorhizobium sp. M0134]|uniref:hypothetical protein n=1 Tax=Mesorhizobium sp. M0134 TaxID=2956889 RepID=UPI001FD9AB47|nr:hypothetical protein [Mesorhizobium sp. LNHC220B00]
MVSPETTVLAVGTPSVSRYLDVASRDSILVDRQPFQNVRKHIVADVGEVTLKIQQSVAILDPPWYPAEAKRWIAWAAAVVGQGSQILVTLWPEHTRPTGSAEREELAGWIGGWGKLDDVGIAVEYLSPEFEQAALRRTWATSSGGDARRGDLLSISVNCEPSMPLSHTEPGRWIRFTINDYQLAVRDTPHAAGLSTVAQVLGAEGWTWPHVSRRALGRENIGLWSSQNEAAVVSDGHHLIQALRAYLHSELPPKELFLAYPSLEQWRIPKPPFWRVAEWQHRS